MDDLVILVFPYTVPQSADAIHLENLRITNHPSIWLRLIFTHFLQQIPWMIWWLSLLFHIFHRSSDDNP